MFRAMELKRHVWHSRRGMLELDILLLPFARHALANLNEQQQATYVRLLEQQDPDLLAWFMGYQPCADKALAAMVAAIQNYAHAHADR